ncbi:MAG: AAA family ATPase [Lautropia sp.]|nr:AAA family ATPase [Lautropia sp.]
MRIQQLRLIRYGKFTDRVLDFPSASHDIHLIVGPNEAGKSTVRKAISEWLFGIATHTPLDFLHEKQALRVGGVLTDAQDTHRRLDVERRKGNKQTLRTPDDSPLADNILQPWLGYLDGPTFARMHALDHDTLVKGSKDILQEKDNVGRMLFQSAAGITHLGELLKQLKEESDKLWAPRKSANRLYYEAATAHDEARKQISSQQLRSKDWQAAHQALTDTTQKLEQAREQLARLKAQDSRLERMHRVQPLLQSHQAIQTQLDALATDGMLPPLLPEDAGTILEEANRQQLLLAADMSRLQDTVDACQHTLDTIQVDEHILAMADGIEALNNTCLRLQNHPTRLQKHQAHRRTLWQDIQRHATELGWPAEDEHSLRQHLPPRPLRQRLHDLIDQHAALQKQQEDVQRQQASQQQQLQQARHSLTQLGTTHLPLPLRGWVEQAGTLGDVPEALQTLQQDQHKLQQQLDIALSRLGTGQTSADALATMLPPDPSLVQSLIDQQRDDDSTLQSLLQSRKEKQQEIRRLEQQLQHLVQQHQPISLEDVQSARHQRDEHWRSIRHDPSRLPTQADAFEQHLKQADILSDERLARAEHEAERQSQTRLLEKLHLEELFLTQDCQALKSRIDARTQEWQTLAAAAGLPPLPLKLAPGWLQQREQVLQVHQQLTELRQQTAQYQEKISTLHQALAEALGAPVTRPSFPSSTAAEAAYLAEMQTLAHALPTLLDQARERIRQADRTEGQRGTLRQQIDSAQQNLLPLTDQLRATEEKLAHWRIDWQAALQAMNHDPATPPQQLQAQLSLIEDIDRLLTDLRTLQQDEIDTLQAELEGMADTAQALASRWRHASGDERNDDIAHTKETTRADDARSRSLADNGSHTTDPFSVSGGHHPDAAGRQQAAPSPADISLTLMQRLATARQADAQRQQCRQQHQQAQQQLQHARQQLQHLQADLAHLMTMAGLNEPAHNLQALGQAIERSNQRRTLSQQLQRDEQALIQQGDGLSIAELYTEAAQLSPDQLQAERQMLTARQDTLVDEIGSLSRLHGEQQGRFDQLDGNDKAAQAAMRQQEAISQMVDAAERFLQLDTAAQLLTWSIEKFRARQQGPMLARASLLFNQLTRGAFEQLQIDEDSDLLQPGLLAIRASDRLPSTGTTTGKQRVPIDGLSEGTRDQLYLALRLAALDLQVDAGQRMPLIADDLFINFDDQRTEAGLKVLGELSQRTQIIFLTHHDHLVPLARRVLGDQLNVIMLEHP